MSDMGTFRTNVEIENPRRPGDRVVIEQALVDTGAELSWFPRALLEELGVDSIKVWHFPQADGTVLSRWTGAVSLMVAGVTTVDEVVFGESSDLVLLGARSLEGLNLRVEPAAKRLVDAGPAPAAANLIAEATSEVQSVTPSRRSRLVLARRTQAISFGERIARDARR